MERLDGRIAIVTGGARGVGSAIARRLIEAGARVVLGDLRDEAGESTAAELGGAATYLHLDVTREADWAGAVKRTLADHGRIDILVNNAGRLHMGAIENTSPEEARGVVEVNLIGPFLGIRAVAPAMKAQGKGAIVNVGSVDGMLGMNGVAMYAASKWALRGLAKSAALELGRSGIRVNTVCPAGGNPEMYGPWMEQLAGMIDQTKSYTEDRALPGEAPLGAIADAVLFLASDDSRHCTGIDLPVDGGAHAGRFMPGFNEL
ncbi:MAG: 3-alpha-hydroxysteroid dehydrogenase [Deltaproteobacteria bacterium]|jgi:3alpha(or 20beta)-hydroxysteroid dehydrogenase|nr:3-alpha-hydroxysteroid dehydrogenase [Deltaproteobacteria bacterium]